MQPPFQSKQMKFKPCLYFAPIFLIPFIDLAIKQAVFAAKADWTFGPIVIRVVLNRGLIGGVLSNQMNALYQVPLVSAGLLLLAILYFLQFLAPIKSTLFRFTISLFFAGILANIIDRVAHGYVIDYLSLQWGHHQTAFHNFADYCQYLAIGLLFALQFRKNIFDPKYDSTIWINKAFQKRYMLQLIKLGVALLVIFGGLSFSFMSVIIEKYRLLEIQSKGIYESFFVFYISLSLVFLIFLFFVGRRLSAHILKPIGNFEHYLRKLSQGEYDVFHCEEQEFSYLETLSDEVRDHLNQLSERLEKLEVRTHKSKDKN